MHRNQSAAQEKYDNVESQSFSKEKELAKLTAEWPASRLVETWNSFAGVAPYDDLKPVKKFTDRLLHLFVPSAMYRSPPCSGRVESASVAWSHFCSRISSFCQSSTIESITA